MTNTRKPCLASLALIFIRLHFLSKSSGCEEETMKTESPAFVGQTETTCHEDKKERRQSMNFFFFYFFHCNYNVLVRWPNVWCETHFFVATLKWGLQLSAVFSLPYLVFNWLFLPRRVRLPNDCLFSPFPHSLASGVFIRVPFSQSELVVDLLLIRFYV